jgi:hypothetical protein
MLAKAVGAPARQTTEALDLRPVNGIKELSAFLVIQRGEEQHSHH